jgi:ZIP family zinc transporter
MSDQVFGIMSALAGGIMIFISMDELLPTAIQYGEAHIATYGLA